MGHKSTAIFYKRISGDHKSERSDMWEILEMMEKRSHISKKHVKYQALNRETEIGFRDCSHFHVGVEAE